MISVWDSERCAIRFFAERLARAYEAAGLSMESIKHTVFDVHAL